MRHEWKTTRDNGNYGNTHGTTMGYEWDTETCTRAWVSMSSLVQYGAHLRNDTRPYKKRCHAFADESSLRCPNVRTLTSYL